MCIYYYLTFYAYDYGLSKIVLLLRFIFFFKVLHLSFNTHLRDVVLCLDTVCNLYIRQYVWYVHVFTLFAPEEYVRSRMCLWYVKE